VKKKLHQRRPGTRAAEDRRQDGKNVWVLTLPLQKQQQLRPAVSSKHGHAQEDKEEEAVTPRREGDGGVAPRQPPVQLRR
jgi:hypothetical protein